MTATHGSGSSYNTGVVYKINGQTVTESNYVSNYNNNGGGSGLRGIVWTVPNTSTTLITIVPCIVVWEVVLHNNINHW